jgi:hypothetical protein
MQTVTTEKKSKTQISLVAAEIAAKEIKGKKKSPEISAELAALLEQSQKQSLFLAHQQARLQFEQAQQKLILKEKLQEELGKKAGDRYFKNQLEALGEYGKSLKSACSVVPLFETLPEEIQNLVWGNLGKYTWAEWEKLLQLPQDELKTAIVGTLPLNSQQIKELTYSYVAKKFPLGLALTRHHLNQTRKTYPKLSEALEWDLLLQKINELAEGADEYTDHLFTALESFGLDPDKVRLKPRPNSRQKIKDLTEQLQQQKQDTSSKLEEITNLIKNLQQENVWLKQEFALINNSMPQIIPA